ncbi:MAG: sortase [Actinomycetota bacterium]
MATLGKFLVSVGVGILLFVGWTLWGTGLQESQAQDRLGEEFDSLPFMAVEPLGPRRIPPANFEFPGPGEPAFRLRVPAIDLRKVVVEGVGVEELKLGPGHYPACRAGFERPLCTDFKEMWPGMEGRVIVSGHRTTYGAPFWDIQKLRRGDRIITETKWGEFVYEVTHQEVVSPESRDVAIPTNQAELVLTTCNPRFSASERLVVFAELMP